MTGIIYDVQRFSVNDGPGIRTTVFFKGCPLRCFWCHNPESFASKPQLSYIDEKCRGCGLCVKACGSSVHFFEEGKHKIDFRACTLCGKCVDVCCYYAVSILGQSYTVDELTDNILGDKPYYGAEGGVTFSGGEPMMQFNFALNMAKRLKDEGIHICMETSAFAPSEQIMEIAQLIDIFLVDHKATKPAQHREFTGVDNELILENFNLLYNAGRKIILRCPLIPDVNDSEQHLRGIAQMSERYPNLLGVEIMAYHRLGISKAKQIGMEFPFNQETCEQEQVERWVEKLHNLGCLKAKIG